MIVSCPSCITRYDLGSDHGNVAFNVTCQRCGHHWQEMPITDLVEMPPRTVLKLIDHDHAEPELDVARLVEAARVSRLAFAEKQKNRWKKTAGWLPFATVAVLPFIFALLAPETLVLAAPIANTVYERLGWPVNIYGVEIRQTEQLNRLIDGEHVLMVKGEISNVTNDIHRIPWLRFALMDQHGKELYTWTLDTGARPLRAGETTSFTTRVAAPPKLAKNLQIRFAHVDEIGSNINP